MTTSAMRVAILAVHVATSSEPLAIPRLTGPIVLDGFSDEAAWQDVPVLTPVMQQPTFGAQPSERTEFRLAYDDLYLYASARFYDSDPTGIRATSLRRNDGAFSNDWFVLGLDTFNDKENVLFFGTTPAGIRTDVAISGDGEVLNFDWNTYWDVAVQVTDEGWFAEIRVPLSSLRFQERDGRAVMGLILWRLIARKNEIAIYPAIPPDWGLPASIAKASRAQEIVLEGVSRTNPVYVSPYLLGGVGRSHQLDATGSSYFAENDPVHDVGLDLKYGVTPNLTLDLTLNTDFAQVEADDQQVNLTRFSLFFPEKRQFFQERAAVFNFPLIGSDRLFYSRRIGLVAGQPARIYGGGRLVGRVGGWDVGVLNMQTAAEGDFASENFGVARVRRRAFNENSYVGAMFTSRVAPGGVHDLAYGADALVRVVGQEYATASWAQTFDSRDTTGAAPFDRAYARVTWQRRGIDGLTYALEVARVGERFDPGVGFVRRRDFLRGGGYARYGWRLGPASRLLRHDLMLEGERYRRNADASTESALGVVRWSAETKTGAFTSLAVGHAYDDVTAGFALAPGVDIPAGSYAMTNAAATYSPPASRPFRAGFSIEAGEYYDGRRISPGASLTWNASRHLQLNANYGFNLVDFPERQQELRTHVARLRTQYMLDARWSLIGFLQYSSLGDIAIFNARLRWNAREGNDLYVVYNEGLNTDRAAYDPVRPLSASRTLMIKYVHTFPFVF